MKNSINLFFILLFTHHELSAQAQHVKPPTPADIEGTVYEMIIPCDTVHTPIERKPAANVKLVMQTRCWYGNKGVPQTIITDANGYFKVTVRPYKTDTFFFYQEWKTKKIRMPNNTATQQWDTACYRASYNTPDYYVWPEPGSKTTFRFDIEQNCMGLSSCCTYLKPIVQPVPPTNRSGNQPGHQE